MVELLSLDQGADSGTLRTEPVLQLRYSVERSILDLGHRDPLARMDGAENSYQVADGVLGVALMANNLDNFHVSFLLIHFCPQNW